MIVLEPTQFIVVVSIVARNENIGQLGGAIIEYVFDRGGNLDVVPFPSCRVSRASLSRSKRAACNRAVVFLFGTESAGKY